MSFGGVIQGYPGSSAAAGGGTPEWTVVDALYGATLKDVSSLDNGSTGFAAGVFTFDRNATDGNFPGYTQANMQYRIPIGGVDNFLPDYDETTDDLWVAIKILTNTFGVNSYNGVSVALCDDDAGDTNTDGQGAGFFMIGAGTEPSVARISGFSAPGNKIVTNLEHVCVRFTLTNTLLGGTDQQPLTTILSYDTSDLQELNEIPNIGDTMLTTGQRYLYVMSPTQTAGNGSGGTATVGIYAKRVPRGTDFPA
jgi:hypothetical protein